MAAPSLNSHEFSLRSDTGELRGVREGGIGPPTYPAATNCAKIPPRWLRPRKLRRNLVAARHWRCGDDDFGLMRV
jgi:hypothetical protein